MRVAGYKLGFRKRENLSGWQAAVISILAVVFALLLFSLVFVQAEASPMEAYQEIMRMQV